MCVCVCVCIYNMCVLYYALKREGEGEKEGEGGEEKKHRMQNKYPPVGLTFLEKSFPETCVSGENGAIFPFVSVVMIIFPL